MARDSEYMRLALELAKKGYGTTSPNPMVGAVLVKNGKIVGQGYHHYAGGAHAEIIALEQAGAQAKGATLYVTLEPCCHYGKTPPCTDRIIQSGITKVIVAVRDPNPLVNGKGIKQLRNAGVTVAVGIHESEAKKLNEPFFKYIRTGLPYGILKLGMSFDGKIATRTGESRWITSAVSRHDVHYLRAGVDAIIVGANTVIHDDPELTVRIPQYHGRQPKRIVVDSIARVPITARVFRVNPAETILATTRRASSNRINLFTTAGVAVWVLPRNRDGVNLRALFTRLGKEQVQSVLIEGGATLAWSCLSAGLIDKVILYLAPKLIGGQEALSAIGGKGITKLRDAFRLYEVSVTKLGEDIKIEAYMNRKTEERKNEGMEERRNRRTT
ncbi:MAG: bifunctional diaminohydroxyphosphoribosylaminopyrimidine deaminase/5-amino-6-(5-phosphoribosylamino)uracil reductase RibD [bacterium]|nr:bifunctional diaminohydroxyphosphoribosylaminopyrimidine deaminase/5-amino-6-(5-phosphoribosylamino)uracil reductase RibD [bacterium]